MATQIPEKMPEVPTTETRKAYEERVKAELVQLNTQISEFKVKADQAKAEAEANYQNAVQEVTAKRDALVIKLEEMQSSGEAAWQELQRGFEIAWNELAKSFENASKQFDK